MPETACAARDETQRHEAPPVPMPKLPRGADDRLRSWGEWRAERHLLLLAGMSPEFGAMAPETGFRLSDPEQITQRIQHSEHGYPRQVERALKAAPDIVVEVLAARYCLGVQRSVRFVAESLSVGKAAAEVRIAYAEGWIAAKIG